MEIRWLQKLFLSPWKSISLIAKLAITEIRLYQIEMIGPWKSGGLWFDANISNGGCFVAHYNIFWQLLSLSAHDALSDAQAVKGLVEELIGDSEDVNRALGFWQEIDFAQKTGYTLFFNKNHVYKNVEAQISQKLKTC